MYFLVAYLIAFYCDFFCKHVINEMIVLPYHYIYGFFPFTLKYLFTYLHYIFLIVQHLCSMAVIYCDFVGPLVVSHRYCNDFVQKKCKHCSFFSQSLHPFCQKFCISVNFTLFLQFIFIYL